MKVPETRSQARAAVEDEGKAGNKKHKTEAKRQETENKNKRSKSDNGNENEKSAADVAAEFNEFCKATLAHLSIEEMRRILDTNDQDSSGSDDAVVPKCQDMMFYGPLGKCPLCDGVLEFCGDNYCCKSFYSEWSSCTYSTRDPPRKEERLNLPDGINDAVVVEWFEKQIPTKRPHRSLTPKKKPFKGMVISLSGRLSRTHEYWIREIVKHGGKVSNSVIGVTCLVVSPAERERERGGSSKVIEAIERGIPVVSEAWLQDSIEKQEAQPLEAYDVVSDLAAELKMYGKRSVHKDSKLDKEGGFIFEKDGILYNCALSVCDQGRDLNEYCVMQLIMVPSEDNGLHLYYKKGRVGDDTGADERLEERDTSVDETIAEFARLFKELTGNEFEPWEREKKFTKRRLKFYPIDIDDGVDARYGGLGLRQLGAAAVHTKLEPLVAKVMKVLCAQEVYRYAMMEMALDSPDIPVGIVTDFHLKKCEEALLEIADKMQSMKNPGPYADPIWAEFSNKWFTLLHSTRPFIFRSLQELADNGAAVLESVRDIVTASRLIGDMTGPTLDDPLFNRYTKIGCTIQPLEKGSDDYNMIVKYLEKTYEPIQVGEVTFRVFVQQIYAVESSGCPSFEDIKKLPNKFLLWCGTRTSNLLRHLQKGFLPAICSLPAPGYMFGRAIVCSDAATEAARCGFTAVDRPDGFLILAVASLGEEIMELTAVQEDTKDLEKKKKGVKGLGRKNTDESEHFMWKDDIKVPCGKLIPSGRDDSPLEYTEYAVYDPKQVSMRFVVAVRYEEQNVVMDVAEEE